MSVQSEIDRITAEVASQADLIAQIAEVADNLPGAGSGGTGGAALGTCTVNIPDNTASGWNLSVAYTALQDGEIVSVLSDPVETITDALCGTTVTFLSIYNEAYPIDSIQGAEKLWPTNSAVTVPVIKLPSTSATPVVVNFTA